MNVNPHLRTAQKRRTRKAIVDAAIALLARGETPTVNDVAAAAEVSRRTVYLYFPSFDQLLLDATVGALSQASVDRAIEQTSDDGEARVEHLVRALHNVSPEVERLGRSLIRLTVDAYGAPAEEGVPRRSYRRIEWIEQALSPLRDRLDPDRWTRLVQALAMVIGWEALIVQRDVCGLGATEGEALSVWAANALVKAALEDERNAGAPASRG
ncbi:TetR/AcrR family transcriptional regulator [Mesorhizobium sp. VK23B]|uniref:TetR/AcrR family transcriptional regulator n=1 Tax=Mesorhizobium dulcispinae TaxID=3072316 RepID=A0ABU4XPL7_9HYPH|nr:MULTISPECIES: TetR/AcrR family transcriptional regulator [unclassified Mesorhizobium]MDX8470314.1 TetR/AcrR family transcriptional regulator [Mesorhizobium sp. VK23B]MDX8476699.1 TetR/AcrR family transcriptional regulator [Mesorhizobium sp. VK23A]